MKTTKKIQYRQVELKDGDSVLMTNLPDHPRLRPGSRLTLRDEPERWWSVTWVSENTRDKQRTDWNNNI